MLEGGADGELLRDMEDYFYYSQVRRQGVSSKHAYKVGGWVVGVGVGVVVVVAAAVCVYVCVMYTHDLIS